ncbi:hypothetical protein H5410_014003 [Solanum commersonii]|uniref:Uncharacterized protein n=1 Tax=Solanum commersonii TaxID=4109 RepID=A0A9J5ZPZ4_SOLCO|nr:hypothetical protein H5410_014003 [Solanum commersonii]
MIRRCVEQLSFMSPWHNLVTCLGEMIWKVGSKGCFTVNSAYEDLNTVGIEESKERQSTVSSYTARLQVNKPAVANVHQHERDQMGEIRKDQRGFEVLE